jgi:nicotinate-nucleotide adenylyltransferase
MKKIGILGGTFHPIHNGHLHIADAALHQFQLDEVWFMPAGSPPHKKVKDDITPEQRLKMVSLAIAPYPAFSICDLEVHKEGPCYTWETLKNLHDLYAPDKEFYFIMGEDSFYCFAHWVHPEIICNYATILVARRPDGMHTHGMHLNKQGRAAVKQIPDVSFETLQKQYQRQFHQDFTQIKAPVMDISSSDLRKNIYDIRRVSSMVPEAVLKYIVEQQLYVQHFSMEEIRRTARKLKKELNESRFEHTIGVMFAAANLASAYKYPADTAMMAGLLHDCAKCLSDEQRLSICREHGIEISPVELASPHLLHGKVGAYLAKKKYGVEDENILHAIAVHTTGVPQMSLLDRIIFVADYIEPNRCKAPRLNDIRFMAYHDLDHCVYSILKDTVDYLYRNRGNGDRSATQIDPLTEETYQYYKQLEEEKHYEA